MVWPRVDMDMAGGTDCLTSSGICLGTAECARKTGTGRPTSSSRPRRSTCGVHAVVLGLLGLHSFTKSPLFPRRRGDRPYMHDVSSPSFSLHTRFP